jgi:hypothetical protein
MAHNPQNRARKPQHQSRALLRAVPGSREQSDADGHAGGAGKICGSYTAVRSPVWIEGRGCCADECVRYTNSLTTQMMFGFRTTSIEDPKLVQLFHVSSYPFTLSHHHKPNTWSMAVLTHARTPGFRALLRPPQLLLRPLRHYAKELHEKEKELYVGHWLNFKKVRNPNPTHGIVGKYALMI